VIRTLRSVFFTLILVFSTQTFEGIVVSVHFSLLTSNLVVTKLVQSFKLLDFFSKLVLGGLEAEVIFFVMVDIRHQFSDLFVEVSQSTQLVNTLELELTESKGLLLEGLLALFKFSIDLIELSLDVSDFFS